MSSKAKTLAKTVDAIVGVTAGERDMYPYIRDLITSPAFGVGLAVEQVVVDSSLAGNSGAPDLAIYQTSGKQVVKTQDHLFAVIEAKTGNSLVDHGLKVFEEKKKYVQVGTSWFFLVDQVRVIRRNVEHDFSGQADEFYWEDLKDQSAFIKCFGVISKSSLRLEADIEKFVAGRTRFAYRDIDSFGRSHFVATVREVSQQLQAAVRGVVESRIIPDLKAGKVFVDEMELKWGPRSEQWNPSGGHPIEFSAVTEESGAKKLSRAKLDEYQEDHDNFAIRTEPYLYALEIEHSTLQTYAERLGIEAQVSLLASDKASAKVVESFTYETASLIVSRMLMIRFSEDHGFMVRHISNGGVTLFQGYAKHFKRGYQTLLRQTYDSARNLYRGLFDEGILDWVLNGAEPGVSEALLHAMYLLSRWDFKTVKGDILSGVYDHYLDTSKRRALGEVFTRPEISRYILKQCGFGPEKTLLDPACGSGTFIVEALEQELSRLRAAGVMNTAAVKGVLKNLCGLDINPFSVSLAQIQVLWHLMGLFASAPEGEAKGIAAELLPAINIQGGLSSLDTMGIPMVTSQAQPDLDLDVTYGGERRKGQTRFPPRFRKLNSAQYDIVVGNPPYVRAHRREQQSSLKEDYAEVAEGQFDLYILFLYRALRTWLKPGGRLGFILPMALLEAGYAGLMRQVLGQYRIVEIVDLELLKKKTFHGVKRPTVIVIVENAPGSPDELVMLTTLHMGCYSQVDDSVDVALAARETLKRSDLYQTSYLGDFGSQSARQLFNRLDFASGERAEWSTKITAKDVGLLKKIGGQRKLGEITATAWQQRGGKGKKAVACVAPSAGSSYEEMLLIGEGYKLGSNAALKGNGPEIFKGQNIFPGGIIGEPMGRVDASKASSANLYRYAECFKESSLFAIRQIAQLPVACAVRNGVVFQNTAYLIQLRNDFPLHAWCMSRVVQYYAAKVLRGSVIEDLSAHWYRRQIALLPIPLEDSQEDHAELLRLGEALVDADRNLANQYRHIDAAIAQSGTRSLQDMIVSGATSCGGIDLTRVAEEDIPLTGLRSEGTSIQGDDLLFRVSVPDTDLRDYLLFALERAVIDEPVVSRKMIMGVQIPSDLAGVAKVMRQVTASSKDRQDAFNRTLDDLDQHVGHMLGLDSGETDFIADQMRCDNLLKQVSILWEHRGMRVQLYKQKDHDSYG